MTKRVVIDPIPRVEGHLRIEVLEALDMQKEASAVTARLGGKMPMHLSTPPGGTTFVPTVEVLASVLSMFGGLVSVRIWHTAIMWVFLSFTAVHVYLVLTEDARLVKAMVDGYYFRKAGHKGGS